MIAALLLASLGIVPIPQDEAPPVSLDQLRRIQAIFHESDALPTRLPAALMAQVQPPASPPSPPPDEDTATTDDGLTKHLSVGASVANAQSTTATKPYVEVMADFPAVGPVKGAPPKFRIRAEATLSGTTAQSGPALATQLAAGNLSAFYALSAQGSFHYVLRSDTTSRATVSIQAGVSSVLGSGASQPTTANPAHGEACLGFWKKNHSADIDMCPVGFSTEVGDAATVGRVRGRVTISGSVPLRFGVDIVYPYGNAPSNWYVTNTVHNVLTTASISYDFDKVVQSSSSGSGQASHFVPRKVTSEYAGAGGRSGGAGASGP